MDLVEGLRSFCAVAAERSFTRGAERCGQPQPVASRRVAALEERLGTTLLVRTSRRVALSPDGERLLPLAREIVARADRVDRLFIAARPSLVVAVPTALTASACATVRRGLPGTGFLADDPAARAEALRAGAAHLALLPVAVDEADVVVPLGLAHHDPQPAARLHLDQLRRPVRERDQPARAVHVLAEDDVPAVRDPLRAAARAAGLRADQVAVGTEPREAWIRVHEHGDAVLASAAEARREGLAWSVLARPRLARGYRVAGDGVVTAAARCSLVARLADGLGGTVAARAA